MSDMFRHYPQPDEYIPNNYPRCHCHKPLEIMAGETVIHSFEIPFNVEEDCQIVEIIYKLGLEPVLIKNNFDNSDYFEIHAEDEGRPSVVSCTLHPAETLLFKNTALDTYVQLKFYMKDHSIMYSEIYKVKVRDALDANRKNEIPSSLTTDSE